jgi:hypothetical protein
MFPISLKDSLPEKWESRVYTSFNFSPTASPGSVTSWELGKVIISRVEVPLSWKILWGLNKITQASPQYSTKNTVRVLWQWLQWDFPDLVWWLSEPITYNGAIKSRPVTINPVSAKKWPIFPNKESTRPKSNWLPSDQSDHLSAIGVL